MADSTDELRNLINGYQVTQAIHVIVELGIPDMLADEPRSARELAEAVNANEEALYRVLRALATKDLVHESADHRFTLASLGEILRRDNERSLAPWAALVGSAAHWNAWSNLSHSVRTGENAFRFTHGVDVWDYRREHLEESRLFDNSMTAQTRTADSAITTSYEFGAFRTIADIGGGNGALLAAILQANPGSRGILFDQEHVVAAAPALLSAGGVADRCTIVSGNFFESVPSGADAYVLKWIIHDWQDPEAIAILDTCRKAMGADARVLIIEREIDAPNEGPVAKWMDLQMLVMAGGRERTRTQFEELLGRAQLKLVSATPTPGSFVVFEAARA